jgi:hypothetical protein
MNLDIIRILSDSKYNNKSVLVILSVVVVALTTEISLVKIYNLAGSPSPFTFLIIAAVSIFGQYYFLEFVNKKSKAMEKTVLLKFPAYKIIKIIQYLLAIILVFIFFQMFFTSHYYTILLTGVTIISYMSAVVMMGFLTQRFFSWFRLHGTFIVLAYGLSSAALTINAGLSMAFATSILSNMPVALGPHTQDFYFLPISGSLQYWLDSAYVVSSIVSFVLTWMATALLLRPHSQRLGIVRYWVIVSLPLAYFLSQFPFFFLNLFASALASDPVFYGTLLSVIFSVSKASGGILFGVAFWTMARTFDKNTAVPDYLIIAAVGFVLFFVSDQAVVLNTAPYPPLGLASISFMGLSSYLILRGIYSSAISVSQDSKLRQSIRNFAVREARLLDSIGTAHLEQEIEKRVVEITMKYQDSIQQEAGIQSSVTEKEMKDYLQDVLREVKIQKEHTRPSDVPSNTDESRDESL